MEVVVLVEVVVAAAMADVRDKEMVLLAGSTEVVATVAVTSGALLTVTVYTTLLTSDRSAFCTTSSTNRYVTPADRRLAGTFKVGMAAVVMNVHGGSD